MGTRFWVALAAGLLAGGGAGYADPPGGKPEEKPRPEAKFVLPAPVTVDLEQVPAFGKSEEGDASRFRYSAGQMVICRPERPSELKACPNLQSKEPLFGCVWITDGRRSERYFVVDESGDKPSDSEAGTGDQKPDQKSSRTTKYDRLYFDVNGDGDLTNDGVLRLAKEPLVEGVREYGVQTFADALLVFDGGKDTGKLSFAVVPRLRSLGRGFAAMEFAPRFCRQGTIGFGDQQFSVRMSQSRMISGRYDAPTVNLEFAPRGQGSRRIAEALQGPLGGTRVCDEQIVRFSASPTGDRLTVEPYRGDCGILEVGAGGRAITRLGVGGELLSKSGPVLLGPRGLSQVDELPRQIKLPVGDYAPAALNVVHGRLLFNCRRSTPARGKLDGQTVASAYNIKIRNDETYRLEFSGKPEVVVNSAVRGSDPSKPGGPFKPGQMVRISAMLTEPTQGIMITGLWRISPKQEKPLSGPGGFNAGLDFERLDPIVTIYSAKGEKIVEGKMPFG